MRRYHGQRARLELRQLPGPEPGPARDVLEVDLVVLANLTVQIRVFVRDENKQIGRSVTIGKTALWVLADRPLYSLSIPLGGDSDFEAALDQPVSDL